LNFVRLFKVNYLRKLKYIVNLYIQRMPKKSSKYQKSSKQLSRKGFHLARDPLSLLQIQDCSKHYLESLYDPENVTGACMPSGFPIPSVKKHYKCYGTMVTNTTNGVGAIIFRHDIGNNSTAVGASTDPAVYVVSTTPAMIGTAGTTYTAMNSDFTTAELAANNTYRVVSACLKVKYVGREDAMGGTMTWCEQADHITLAANTVGALRDRSTSSITRVSKEWQQLNYSGPIAPVDLEFVPSTDNSKALPFMALLVNAAVVAESLTFEWEAHINVEIIGVNALGKTATHSDPVGFGAISSAVKDEVVDKSFMPGVGVSLSSLASSVGENLPSMETVVNVGKAAAGLYTGQPGVVLKAAADLLSPRGKGKAAPPFIPSSAVPKGIKGSKQKKGK